MRKKTIEEFAVQLAEVHGDKIKLRPGATYTTTRKPIKVECGVCDHQWCPTPANLLIGKGCPQCNRERVRDISRALVGSTNADGVKALDVTFEWKKDKASKAGGSQSARLRCRCPFCGNEGWMVQSSHFRSSGNSKHCGCQGRKRENINTFLNNEGWATSPSMFYVASIYYDTFTKPGITNDFNRRATEQGKYPDHCEYGGNFFCSKLLPRAVVWVIEQIILKETKRYEVPDSALPQEMLEPRWGGRSELRSSKLDPDWFRERFFQLLEEIETTNWLKVYDKHLRPYKQH